MNRQLEITDRNVDMWTEMLFDNSEEKICNRCGETFQDDGFIDHKKNKIFCSLECMNDYK